MDDDVNAPEIAAAVATPLKEALASFGVEIVDMPTKATPDYLRAVYSWQRLAEELDMSDDRYRRDVIPPIVASLAGQIAGTGWTSIACGTVQIPASATGAHARDGGLVVRAVQSYDIESDNEVVRVDVTYDAR